MSALDEAIAYVAADSHDAAEPNLRASTRTISLRLPEHMLEELKLLANKHDVPYQSLLKMFLAERIKHELRGSPRRAS